MIVTLAAVGFRYCNALRTRLDTESRQRSTKGQRQGKGNEMLHDEAKARLAGHRAAISAILREARRLANREARGMGC